MPEVLSPSPDIKAPSKSLTADDINDLFKADKSEEKIVPEKPLKEAEKELPKDVEEPEDDLELKEPEDEDIEKLDLKQEEDIEVDAPPRKKEILAKFPELFKTFPFLEKIMYRDRQYNELFGSFDDAKELAGRAETFSNFENQLMSGDTKEILSEVKTADPKAFDKIVDEYLPSLAAVDKEAYFHVVGNLNKRLIMEMVKEANDTNNDDLKQAAMLVNQFVFGSSKFTAPENRIKQDDTTNEAKNEVEQERLNLIKERFESSRDELQSQVDNTLRATISDYIDPKGVMSPYVKKNAVADAMKILTDSIAADPSVSKNLSKLWKVSFDSKFAKDDLGKIKSFYLSKAKGNLKNAIMKARAEALKELAPKREKEAEVEEEEETPRTIRKTIATGRTSQPRTGKNEMKKGESVSDFFARD